MDTCPKWGYVEPVICCEVPGCLREAEYEGWYSVRDFAGMKTGLIQRRQVCAQHVSILNGTPPNTASTPTNGGLAQADNPSTPAAIRG